MANVPSASVINPKISLAGILPEQDGTVSIKSIEHYFRESLTSDITVYTGTATDITFSYNDVLPGDGAVSKFLSIWNIDNVDRVYGNNSKYIFKEPGNYKVTLSVFDQDGEIYLLPEPYECNIRAIDYISTGVSWSSLTGTAIQSHKSSPLTLNIYKSWQYTGTPTTISLYVSGSQSIPLTPEVYDEEKHIHLIPTHRIVQHAGSEYDAPISELVLDEEPYSVKVGGSTVTVGTSGSIDLSLVDDNPGTVNIFATFNNPLTGFINTKPAAITTTVSEYTGDVNLSVTTTGLPFFTLSGVSGIRFEGTDIPIVITAVTDDGILLPKQTQDISAISLSASNISSDLYTTSSRVAPYDINSDIFKTIKFNNLTDSQTTSIQASADIGPISVTGASSNFNLVTTDDSPKISKINESKNLYEIIKTFILQETINSKPQFINSFLKSVIGDSTVPSYIGTRIYEKISNFNMNVNDVDLCNVDALLSLAESVGYQDISKDSRNWPGEFKRLLDILSISQQKLFGYKRPMLSNYDKKGFTDNPSYGANLGSLIGSKTNGVYDCSTYTVTAGNDIVAKQIFNNEYIHVSTMMVSGNNTYSLSAYEPNWGWGLYTESDTTGIFDLHDNYELYEYKTYDEDIVIAEYESQVENNTYQSPVSGYSSVNNVIDWETTLTNISFNSTKEEWSETITKLIENDLRSRLNLFT